MVHPQALLDELGRAPEVPAFEHGSRVTSRRELRELVGRFTAGLRAAGLGPGGGGGGAPAARRKARSAPRWASMSV
jgi:fatty-acyl-CoA synthase